MRVLITLFISFLNYSSLADEATDRLKEAAVSRAKFYEVTADIELRSRTAPDKKKVFPYIALLPRFEAEAKHLGLDELASPIPPLAQGLTRSGMKWVDLCSTQEKDPFWRDSGLEPLAFTKLYLFYAEDDTRENIAATQNQELRRITHKSDLLLWAERTQIFLTYMSEIKAAPHVVRRYEKLHAATIEKIYSLRDQLSAREMMKLLENTSSADAIEELLIGFENRIHKSTDSSEIKTLLLWTLVLDTNLKHTSEILPVSQELLGYPGRLQVEGILKVLGLRDMPDIHNIRDLVLSLNASAQAALATRLVDLFKDKALADNQSEFLQALNRHFWSELEALDPDPQLLTAYRRLAERAEMHRFVGKENIEGTYRVSLNHPALPKQGNLVISHTGASDFIMGLYLESGKTVSGHGYGLDWSFFHVAFNAHKGHFEAHHFALDSEKYPHRSHSAHFMGFKIKFVNGTPELYGKITAARQLVEIRAKRYETYPAFEEVPYLAKDTITGVYVDPLRPRDRVALFTQVGHRMTGNYFDGTNRVDLIYGYYNAHRDSVYLTSGELDSERWTQLRGQFKRVEETSAETGEKIMSVYFEGVYIGSASGILHQVRLKRMPFELFEGEEK